MASNNFSPSRKHRNSSVATTFRRGILLSNNTKQSGYTNSPVNFGRRFQNTDGVTARKLAAAFWQLRSSDAVASTKIPELLSPMQHLKRSKEDATKWDPALPTPFNHNLLLQDIQLVGDRDSIITILVEELRRAQRSVAKLKAAQKSSKKRVEQFLESIQEEKLSWKHRQRDKIRATVDDLKDKLARETRSRMRMESLNAKLAHRLAEANLSAKQFMMRYEKEKKERELTEQVCNELATQIGEDRANNNKLDEGLMSESSKICKEPKMIASFDHNKEKAAVSCSTRNCDDLHKICMKKNPHISREIKGFIEWPRGIPNKATTSSKVIPLEERIRSQKSQIQNILRSNR
ncbi:hypothetical protein PIB30_017557 [Stylosanthes scabra]|uniref:Uncharacterized protein n=1 Tax=Stylosanthes scabra TaxID=79078 RepID=A0ABU6T9A9_9FABA|nr:hypothetical protein [Stylosanthes scabra]